MESRVVHDGNEELIIFKAICYFQSEREEIPSQPTNAPPSYTSTAAVDGGWRGAYQHDFVCSSKASPQGNRAQEQGISTAFFLRSRRSNPRLLDQIPRLNCSCIRRFNCDIYESMANIMSRRAAQMCKHMNFNALCGVRRTPAPAPGSTICNALARNTKDHSFNNWKYNAFFLAYIHP